jgi:hypothetical protein
MGARATQAAALETRIVAASLISVIENLMTVMAMRAPE